MSADTEHGKKREEEAVIVAMEWRDGRPFEVIVCTETYCDLYDVEWSQKHGQLFWHLSGGMPRDTVQEPSAGLEHLPPGVTTFEALCERLEMHQGEVVYCQECDDHLPTSGDLCEHIWWDDEGGWWSGPGYVECTHQAKERRQHEH